MKRRFRRLYVERRPPQRPQWRAEFCIGGDEWVSRTLFSVRDARFIDESRVAEDPLLISGWRRARAGKEPREKEAERRALEMEGEILQEQKIRMQSAVELPPLCIAQVADEEIRGPGHGGRVRSAGTRNNVKRTLDRFSDWLATTYPVAARDIRRVSFVIAEEYVADLVRRGLAEGARRNARTIVNRMFVSANRRHRDRYGAIENPFSDIEMPTTSRSETKRQVEQERTLSDQERRALQAATKDQCAPAYLYPLVLTLLTTACRKGEVIESSVTDVVSGKASVRSGLTWKAINWSESYATICGKTGTRDVPIVPELAAALREYELLLKQTRMLHETVFVRDAPGSDGGPVPVRDPSAAFKSALSRAGIRRRVRIHDLRHTAASFYGRMGMPQNLVKDLLGHADLTTTSIYSHALRTEIVAAASRISEGEMARIGHANGAWRPSDSP